MKGVNLIKMLFFSIHPPCISWFYHNQSNFFLGIIFLIKHFFMERPKSRRVNCLVLPHASYGPGWWLANHSFSSYPWKAGLWLTLTQPWTRENLCRKMPNIQTHICTSCTSNRRRTHYFRSTGNRQDPHWGPKHGLAWTKSSNGIYNKQNSQLISM